MYLTQGRSIVLVYASSPTDRPDNPCRNRGRCVVDLRCLERVRRFSRAWMGFRRRGNHLFWLRSAVMETRSISDSLSDRSPSSLDSRLCRAAARQRDLDRLRDRGRRWGNRPVGTTAMVRRHKQLLETRLWAVGANTLSRCHVDGLRAWCRLAERLHPAAGRAFGRPCDTFQPDRIESIVFPWELGKTQKRVRRCARQERPVNVLALSNGSVV
jgi:hypothetical protein